MKSAVGSHDLGDRHGYPGKQQLGILRSLIERPIYVRVIVDHDDGIAKRGVLYVTSYYLHFSPDEASSACSDPAAYPPHMTFYIAGLILFQNYNILIDNVVLWSPII